MPIASLETCLDNFKRTIEADVKSLMDLHDREDEGAGRPGGWLIALRRSAIVLLCANFENFCETLACSAFEHLAANTVYARRYPERFRHWLFRQEAHMRNIGIDAAREYITLSLKLYSDIRPLTLDELKLDNLREEFANPTPKNISWLVSLFDEEEYLEEVSLTVNSVETSATAAIGELATRRNKIAHGDTTEAPSAEDVRRLTKFCQLFANRLTRDVSSFTERSL
jgi:hypothetical protein